MSAGFDALPYGMQVSRRRKGGGRWATKLDGIRSAQRTEIDGRSFASKAEATYYAELKLRQMAGEISQLQVQPRYKLVVEGVDIGTYVADFQYFDHRTRKTVVVDVKPEQFMTDLAKLKIRLFNALNRKHGLGVTIVKR